MSPYYFSLFFALTSINWFVPVHSWSTQLPHWTQIPSKNQKCPKDSPEIYFEQIYQHNLKALLNEGRAFFGSLLEALDGAVDDDLASSSEEVWLNTSQTILTEQEVYSERITNLWNLVIGRWEGGVLPWEQCHKRSLVNELLSAIGTEHLHLLQLFQRGVQGILKPVQFHVANVLKLLQTELAASGKHNTTDLPGRIETIVQDIEPTFIGKLLVAFVKKNVSGSSFIGQVLEEVAIVIEAFRNKSSHPYFWREMSQLLVKEVPAEEHFVYKYFSKDEIVKTLVQILQESFNKRN